MALILVIRYILKPFRESEKILQESRRFLMQNAKKQGT